MLRLSALSRGILIALVGFILIFMYVPLLVLVLNSFNQSNISSWPIQDFSFKWWEFAATYEPIDMSRKVKCSNPTAELTKGFSVLQNLH